MTTSSSSLRSYRATFILDTRNLQESVDGLIKKIKEAIITLQGQISDDCNIGVKNFARVTDRQFPAGHYIQFEFNGASTLPATLKERFRLDRSVDRIFVESI